MQGGEIHFNSTFGIVEKRLNALSTIRKVSVSTDGDVEGRVCNSTTSRIKITFTEDFGALTPLNVIPISLSLDGESAKNNTNLLNIQSQNHIHCTACNIGGQSCKGGFYLGFQDVFTNFLPWNSSIFALEAELNALSTLGSKSVYGPMVVNITSTGSEICDASSSIYSTININSKYGNLENLKVINSIRDISTNTIHDFNLTSNRGTKENHYCSNHGICDHTSGTCKCFKDLYNRWFYDSSNGYNEAGGRGDCGYERVVPVACPNACSGYGYCNQQNY